ncbi:hypothetical protein [Bacillus sp. T33-2]|uniref:hypothetical protein n=1 Tax=Bacillus sp. T33-2 TaxID=2054168 RepID=UPI0015E12325|nr:hypothetical protein [Bacillus sp. T33-2]
MIKKQNLINWLCHQIDMEWSCVEDLELTEGEENQFGRGKIAAWEQLLKELQKRT